MAASIAKWFQFIWVGIVLIGLLQLFIVGIITHIKEKRMDEWILAFLGVIGFVAAIWGILYLGPLLKQILN